MPQIKKNTDHLTELDWYLASEGIDPYFEIGNSLDVLSKLPEMGISNVPYQDKETWLWREP